MDIDSRLERTSPRPVEWRVECQCGEAVAIGSGEISCSCGRVIGHHKDGVIEVAGAAPFHGEISAEAMNLLLDRSASEGWRGALQSVVPASLHEDIWGVHCASFQDVWPIPDGSRILDVGAGLGGISAQLALRHHVVALEDVKERARFLAIRKEQDGLDRLTILNGGLNKTCLAPGQFDGIVISGVLEWAGWSDWSAPPDVVQVRFLQSLRRLLAPGGSIYIAIGNRIGWSQWRGAVDHSGLRWTSLMPRFLASWVCASSRNRSEFHAGYRTYTYSYYGYRRLFRRAGLKIASANLSMNGYRRTTEIVPILSSAISYYTPRRFLSGVTFRYVVRNALKKFGAREWIWRRFGGDYVFFLEAEDA